MTHTGAAVLAALSTAAMAADDPHAHHHAHGNPYQGLIAATADCGAKGQICVSHCIELLGQGEKEMAACAKSVSQMLALCGALESLAIQQSAYAPALIKTALESFAACEKECRKHESKHVQCKDCADACANCIKQCKALSL
jgi:Cys-rich four helix bundle protein (predicted Tat secretion target)